MCNCLYVLYLDGWCGPRGWMSTDLAAVLIGSLFVVELQLFGGSTVVVPYRFCLLSCGLIQHLCNKSIHEYGF